MATVDLAGVLTESGRDVEVHGPQDAIELIEGFAPKGECEFVSEFTKVLPIVVFLTMMQLPPEDRNELMGPADAIVTLPASRTDPQREACIEGVRAKGGRRAKGTTGDDLIPRSSTARSGAPIAEEHVVGMCTLVLSGGLDTVKNLLGFIAKFLATHPEHVRQLREKPRDHSACHRGADSPTRGSEHRPTIVKDYEFLGVQLKAGEQLQGVTALVGLDDETFPIQ